MVTLRQLRTYFLPASLIHDLHVYGDLCTRIQRNKESARMHLSAMVPLSMRIITTLHLLFEFGRPDLPKLTADLFQQRLGFLLPDQRDYPVNELVQVEEEEEEEEDEEEDEDKGDDDQVVPAQSNEDVWEQEQPGEDEDEDQPDDNPHFVRYSFRF